MFHVKHSVGVTVWGFDLMWELVHVKGLSVRSVGAFCEYGEGFLGLPFALRVDLSARSSVFLMDFKRSAFVTGASEGRLKGEGALKRTSGFPSGT